MRLEHNTVPELLDRELFQSTHPKRDETSLQLDEFNRDWISIHSSQAG